MRIPVNRILEARRAVAAGRSVLVAVTGIDASGKGHVTARIVAALQAEGVRAAALHVDGWLNLPHVRFASVDPAEHFYRHAIRFEAMFEQLVLPLRDRRSVRIEADFAEETATAYRQQVYAYENVDVVVLEGIYLLKPAFREHYDVSIWVECGFETALRRAVARAQEGLPPADTVRAYREIYFPAQEIHFRRDDPRSHATLIVENDGPEGGPRSD